MFSINSASSGQGQAGSGRSGSSGGGSSGGSPQSPKATHSQASSTATAASGGTSTVVVVMPTAVNQASNGAVAQSSPPEMEEAPSVSTPRCSKLDLTAGVAANGAWMQQLTAAAPAHHHIITAPPKVVAARRLQRWARRLQAEARLAGRVRRELPGHVMALLEAAATLGGGSWGCEWEALCSEARGLDAHAKGLLAGLGLLEPPQPQQQSGSDLLASLLQPEALLSGLLIAAHPEVVTTHMARRAKRSLRHRGRPGEEQGEEEQRRRRRRRRHTRAHVKKGEALAAAAMRVRDALLALHRALIQADVPCWALAKAAGAAARAIVGFVMRRETCREAATAETARLADELTGAAVGALEAISRGGEEAGAARLWEVERALVRLVGAEEARGRMDAARAAAAARLQHGEECATAAAAVESAMVVEAATVVTQQHQQEEQGEQQELDHPQQLASGAVAAAAAAVAAAGAGCPESLFSNEWLIHEICVLPPGRFLQVSLEDQGASGNGQQAYTVHAMAGSIDGDGSGSTAAAAAAADAEAYWASVTRTLLAGDGTPLLVLVQEVAERLISITPSRGDLAAEVTEALDVALLEQVLARDLVDSGLLFSMLRFAGERILWLEAPARNESTQAWLARLAQLEGQVQAGSGGGGVHLSLHVEQEQQQQMQQQQRVPVAVWGPLMAPLFEFLLEKIDTIHIDIFNSSVRRATPACRSFGPAFERERFEERLAAGQASLTRTRQWLAGVLASEWCQQQSFPVPGVKAATVSLAEGLMSNRGDALKKLLRRGYAALLLQQEEQPDEQEQALLPEPLAMDAHRLQIARHGLLCIARAAACLAYLAQALGRPLAEAERATALKELMVLLPVEEADEPGNNEGVSLQVGALARRFSSSAANHQPQQPQQQAAFLALETRVARMLAARESPVLRLLYARVVDCLHLVLEQDGTGTKETAAALAQACAARGLGGFEAWVRRVGEVLLLVCRHNEAGFAALYHQVALEVLLAGESADGAAAAMDVSE